MNVKELKSVHFIGVGGINMSAVAKLLLHAGIKVSGSDLIKSDQTDVLKEKGATINISEDDDNIPEDCELVIVTSAAPQSNRERIAAQQRGIPEMTNFSFLGEWFADMKTVVVAGTHGKSTTTAMLGLALVHAGLDPTVIVGSKVPGFEDGNLRIGKSDLFVVEGDEYARHFLEFNPYGLILNNIELDHVDVFTSIDVLLKTFHELAQDVITDGIIVANESDERVHRLLDTERVDLAKKRVRTIFFSNEDAEKKPFKLHLPGRINMLNALAAFEMAKALGADEAKVKKSLSEFTGIWRRFEFITDKDGYTVYSDYGHHPTAVLETLKATKEMYPNSRVLLCFQPHHRNRTKILFNDFVTSFDEADELVLADIYAVSGRDEDEDMDISSKDLVDAVQVRDKDAGKERNVLLGGGPKDAIEKTLKLAKKNDVVLIMGAGNIDDALREIIDHRA